MFQADTLESKTETVRCDYDLEVMSSIVKFIYTGNFNMKNMDFAREVFKAADYYFLKRLKCLCKSAILTATTSENAISTLIFADLWGLETEDLKKNVLTLICWNYTEVVAAEELLTLSENISNNVVNSFLKAIDNEEIFPL